MPYRRYLTPEEKETFQKMFEAGASCRKIALALKAGGSFVHRHKNQIYGTEKPFGKPPVAKPAPKAAPVNRAPLPPGDPVTWGAITDGTILDGARYPFPVTA